MDTRVAELGERLVPSPLRKGWQSPEFSDRFVADDTLIPLNIELREGRAPDRAVSFEKAGPRERLYFQPGSVRAGIVTCGGLCPGLNNVIRSLVLQLHYHYEVKQVLGFRYGYHGLDPKYGYEPVVLSPDRVSDIHEVGGSVLGTSRGPVDPEVMVEYLQRLGVQVLFPVGGDGTQRGALKIAQAAERRGYPLAVVGIPKTGITTSCMFGGRSVT